ncbi:MAG: PAS domain-containing sensor histidine kinase [Deferrisomatales bacterium]
MTWLLPAQVATLSSTVLLVLVYLYLFLEERERFLGIWAAGWGVYALRFVADLAAVAWGPSPFLDLASQWSAVASGVLLLWGACLFRGRPLPGPWVGAAAVAALWAAAAAVLPMPFLAATLVPFGFLGAAYAWTGFAFLGAPRPRGAGAGLTGVSFVLWGLHKANYPFLRSAEWFAPWGYLLAHVLTLAVALGMLLAYFERARAALERSEERFRALFDHLGSGVAIYLPEPGGADFVIRHLNRAGEAIAGVDLEQAEGRRLLQVFPGARTLGLFEVLQRVARTGEPEGLPAARYRDDRRDVWVENHVYRLPGGEVVAVFDDVTARVRADEELLRYSRRLDTLRELDRAVLSADQDPRHLADAALLRLGDLVASDLTWAARARGEDLELLAARPGDSTALAPGQRFRPGDLGDPEALARGEVGGVADLGGGASLPPVLAALAGAGVRAFAAVPLVSRGRLAGVLGLGRGDPGAFSPADLALAGDVAGVLTRALDNVRLLAEARYQGGRLRAMAEHLWRAEETEREVLSRELHDAVGQRLTALGLNLHVIEAGLPPEARADLGPRLRDSVALLEETTRQIRNLMAELRPPALVDYGLRAGLRWLAEQFAARSGVDARVEGEECTPRLAADREGVLFRVAQEALTNVARHARAARVAVRLEGEGDTCRMVVADDGVGFDPGAVDEGARWGLHIMADRLAAVGGRLGVDSAPGQGTRVTAEVPR